MDKPLTWIGRTLERLREFPAEARREVGHALHLIQMGLNPPDWRPMATVGPGVFEIRIHADGEYRVFYIARLDDAVYVLHAFQKKSRKTPTKDLELGRRNLATARDVSRGRSKQHGS